MDELEKIIRDFKFPKTCSCCKKEHNSDQWKQLDYVGIMETGSIANLEMRNCTCGSTITIPHSDDA